MPFLARESSALSRNSPQSRFPSCGNSQCVSSWLKVWRSRLGPVFEGSWLCSSDCVRTMVGAAIVREFAGEVSSFGTHRHRVPLGLLLLSRGVIDKQQLQGALRRQRASGGLLGSWLTREYGVPESEITKGLSVQWGCPVLRVEGHVPERMTMFAPRLLLEAFQILPLRVAGTALLYAGFREGIDRSLCFAMERMADLKVEAGVVNGSEFDRAHERLMRGNFPRARLVEASNIKALSGTLTRVIEEIRPCQSRMVRVHDYLWLRLWKRSDSAIRGTNLPAPSAVEDVICLLQDFRQSP